jgi:hypothetical protein
MNLLKIKVADEPRLLVSVVRHPYQVILNMEGTKDTLTGIIENDCFVYNTKDSKEFDKAILSLTKSKINFSVEFTS